MIRSARTISRTKASILISIGSADIFLKGHRNIVFATWTAVFVMLIIISKVRSMKSIFFYSPENSLLSLSFLSYCVNCA